MRWTLALLMVLFIAVLAACGGNDEATGGPSGTAAPLGRSGDGLATISGREGLTFSFAEMRDAPEAPAGWQFMGPVYDITARDREGRDVTSLDTPYRLSFTVGDLFPATVLVFENGAWAIVPSEFDSHGVLTAEISHLTPYAAARPTSAAEISGGSGTAASPPAFDGLPTTPAVQRTPRSASATRPGSLPTSVPTVPPNISLPSSVPTFTVAATVGAGEVSAEEAKAALEAAVKGIKNKSVAVTGAAGYSGTVSVAIPPALQATLGSVMGAGGTAYYGLYNGVNEAVYGEAAGGSASGAMTMLVEPKTSMAADANAALADLQKLFPGIPSGLTQVTGTSGAYVFYLSTGNAAYTVGYVSYEGVALAYAVAGTGAYQSLVPQG